MHPLIYIIILNYNGWKDTLSCIQSILDQDYHNFKIVIVDNHSTDNSFFELTSFITKVDYDKIIIVKSGMNGGFSYGNNVGIRIALDDFECKFIWILNNDTIIKQTTLVHLLNHMTSSQKRIGILGSMLLYFNNPDTIQALGGVFNKWIGIGKHIGGYQNKELGKRRNLDLDYVVGASMFVSINFIKDVGLLSEDYFLYYEDVDWSIAAKNKGWLLDTCIDSEVLHKEGASIGSSSKGINKSLFSDIESMKSRLILTRKYYKYCLPTVYLGFLLVILNRISRKQFDRILPILKLLLSH